MLLYRISTVTRDEGNFEEGSIIWNTTEGQLLKHIQETNGLV